MFWKGVWGYLPANIVQGGVGFLAIFIFTRLLSPAEFGQYALAFSVLTLAHVAVFSWLEAAMARYWAAQKSEAEMAAHFASIYRMAFGLIAAFLVIAGLVIWLAPLDGAFKLAVAAGLAGCPPRSLAKLAQERLRAEGEVSRSATLDIITTLGGLAIGIIAAQMGAGGAAPLIGIGLAPLFALPFILPEELRQARRGVIDARRVSSYAAYGYPIAAGLALALVLSSTDRFLLAAFLDEAAVGAYHAGYSIANRTLDVMFVWLGAAGQPALVMALERGGVDRLKAAAREQASTFLLIGMPAAAGVALVARPLAEVMIGPELRETAAAITPWIALSALFYGMTAYYFAQAFTLSHRTKLLLVTMTVPAVLNILLNILLIPHFGVMGAAWATAASFAVSMTMARLLGSRVMPLPVPWETLIRCGVATGLMALAVGALPAIGGFAELMMDATVGGIVYAAAALTLNAAGVRDIVMGLYRRRFGPEAAA
jgi:O-antigen/teichoic acid export membrane protein